MNVKIRLGLCSLLAVIGMAAACSTDDTADDRACVPAEEQPCTCGDAETGVQTCNATGSGFSACDCEPGTGGTGGSATGGAGGTTGGTGGTTGGTGGGGAGGTDAGGTGGAAPDGGDAGPEASTPDGGDGGLTCDVNELDGSADTPCNRCLYQNCCAQLWACADDFCNDPGDAATTESELMLVCLAEAVTGDSGTPNPDLLTQGDIAACAAISGLMGGSITPITSDLLECITGTTDGGVNCRDECVY